MKYDGIIFDLDGTLWNATDTIAEAWRIALADEPDIDRCPTVEELEGVMGMAAEELMYTLFPQLSVERGLQLFDKCCHVEEEFLRETGGILYKGIEDTLRLLSKKVDLFIVSNCGEGYIPCFLDAHKLHHYFKDWECIGRTGKEKWENIRLVVERNHLTSPVYVGDTVLDKQSAKKACVPFINAAYGFGKVPRCKKVNTPEELLELIR